MLSHAFIKNPDFQQTVAVFYADILQFHKHAYRFVRRSGKCSRNALWFRSRGRFFSASIGPFFLSRDSSRNVQQRS